MYLAEDRILCWELVAKRGDAWILKYVASAKGETDVPDTVAEFINQRRRWLNGSFFASTYALTHTMQLFGTQHSRRQVFFLLIQAVYNLCQVVFAWFGLGNYAIFFFVSRFRFCIFARSTELTSPRLETGSHDISPRQIVQDPSHRRRQHDRTVPLHGNSHRMLPLLDGESTESRSLEVHHGRSFPPFPSSPLLAMSLLT